MGFGDQLIATGLARGAKARGVKIAFGEGNRLLWDRNSEVLFRGNPNIAFPGQERLKNVEWIPYYKGHRIYNEQGKNRWLWNMDWRCIPGEIFFTKEEQKSGERAGKDFIVIEPNIEQWKSAAVNKDWGRENYEAVAEKLSGDGFELIQFRYQKGGPIIRNVKTVHTWSFRDAVSILRNAVLYLGPEGGLHHAAAAVGIPAVVLFGGFIPPSVTGYNTHTNLIGSDWFCGSFIDCAHCREAMRSISIDRVYRAVREQIGNVSFGATSIHEYK